MWSCCGSASIKEAREKLSTQVKKILVKHGLNDEDVAAVLMPWRIVEKRKELVAGSGADWRM